MSIAKKLRESGVASGLIVLLAFFLPLSTSALSILGLILLLCWLAEGDYVGRFREVLANPVAVAIFCYLMLYVVALLWTRDLDRGLALLQKQWKYLLLPVLLTTARREHLRYYLGAFLAAMTISVAASFLLWLGLIQARHGTPADPTPFLDRIDYTPFLAWSAFLLAEAAAHRLRGRRRLAAAVLALLFTIDIFLTQGRTGQVAFLVLLSVWIFQFFPGRILRAGMISLVCLVVVTLGAYGFSHNFRNRIDQTVTNVQHFESKPDTSMGQRLTFLRNTWQVVEEHPWLGTGPGDFPGEYRLVNQRMSPDFPDTTDPHDQYLLALANFGPLGLLLLLVIFWRMARFRPVIPDDRGRLRAGFPLFYLTIMVGGSYLTHVHAGFLFILGTALLFRNYPAAAPQSP